MKLYYPGCMENNKQMELHSTGCIGNNKQMKLDSPVFMNITQKYKTVLNWVYVKYQTNKAVSLVCMENNKQIKLYSPRCMDDKKNKAVFPGFMKIRQMKLYHLVCVDNNRKMVLYSLCVWKITVKRSCFTLGVWPITDK
jgi:hypothetical protein